MTGWAELDAELGHWRAAGEVPTFWWRDDDAERPTPPLDRLIDLSERYRVPLHLAVVPAGAEAGLAMRLATCSQVHALQHGFAHRNHEPKGQGASEIGANRDLAAQRSDLRNGWQALIEAGLPRLLPVLVPPWNRIAEQTEAHLPALGYAALSDFGTASGRSQVGGLMRVNCHVDPVRWKDGASFRGIEASLAQLVGHLVQRRTGDVEKAEPTGLLTHHLQTDAATWEFLEALLDRLCRPGDARWRRLGDMLGSAGA